MNQKTVIFIILACWIIGYLFLTKNMRLKRSIKLHLRQKYNDYDEKLWSLLISLWYGFFPWLALLFIPAGYLSGWFQIKSWGSCYILIVAGLLGFFASLTVTTVILDFGHFLVGWEYSEMNEVKWMQQVKKINPLFGVLAALTEEFFLRFLLPTIAFKESNAPANTGVYMLLLSISSAVFIILQMAYVETRMTRFVKLIAGLSISLVSLALIAAFSTPIPSLIMHASYVFFFLRRDRELKSGCFVRRVRTRKSRGIKDEIL